MFVVKYAHWLLGLGLIMVISSVVSITVFGLKLGSDFVGGAAAEVRIEGDDLSATEIQSAIEASEKIELISVTQTDSGTFRVEMDSAQSGDEQYRNLLETLQETVSEEGSVIGLSYSTISPSVGKELQNRSLVAITVVLIVIILFMTYVFRGVSYPVPSLYYGLAAVIALFHDIIIPTGVFAYLSSRGVVEIDLLFVIALLSILGASVNDTIVVFDRVRENVLHMGSGTFPDVVAKSITQTLTRSLYTSVTLLVVLGSIFFFGGESVKYFSLALFLGIFFGAYSSICIASPLLLLVYRWKSQKM